MIANVLAVQWVKPLKTIMFSESSSVLLNLKMSHSDSRADILLEISHIIQKTKDGINCSFSFGNSTHRGKWK